MQVDDTNTGAEIETIDSPVENAAVESEAVTEEVAEDSPEDENEGTKELSKDDELKKVKKALNKKNRYNDNLRSRLRALEAEHAKLKNSTGTKKEAPNMDNFESVIDYMKAENQHFLEEKLGEQTQQQQLSYVEQQKAAIRAQQDQQIESSITELVNTNSEAKRVLSENIAVIEAMPDHIENLMYEIDNPSAAVFALTKEGRLQDLYYMNPYVAAAELVNAQARGLSYLKATPQAQQRPQVQQNTAKLPQAPQPMKSLKGSGSGGKKGVSDMSPDELMKWMNS